MPYVKATTPQVQGACKPNALNGKHVHGHLYLGLYQCFITFVVECQLVPQLYKPRDYVNVTKCRPMRNTYKFS
jgi:hypothetical protein